MKTDKFFSMALLSVWFLGLVGCSSTSYQRYAQNSPPVSIQEETPNVPKPLVLYTSKAPVVKYVKHHSVDEYVRRVGQNLALVSENSNVDWQFALTDSSSVPTVARKDNQILINRNYLTQLQNEAELASVLSRAIWQDNDKSTMETMANAGYDPIAFVSVQRRENVPAETVESNESIAKGYGQGLKIDQERYVQMIELLPQSKKVIRPKPQNETSRVYSSEKPLRLESLAPVEDIVRPDGSS